MRNIYTRNKVIGVIKKTLIRTKLNININYIYNIGFMIFGSIVIQIITGIVLALQYQNGNIIEDKIAQTRESIYYIGIENEKINKIQKYHSIGINIMFMLIYLHVGKSLYYRSNQYPREGLYQIGIIILIMLIVISFLGYSIIMGNMSYWAISVITNILTIIPIIGKNIIILLLGNSIISSTTITRFYILHVILPLVLIVIIIIHIYLLHNARGSNILTVNTNTSLINFNSLYTIKDIYTIIQYIIILTIISLSIKDRVLEADNYINSNNLVTPSNIVPPWYLLPYYTILRNIENKQIGVILLIMSIAIICILSYSERNLIRSMKFTPLSRIELIIYGIIFLILIQLGQLPIHQGYSKISKIIIMNYYIQIIYIGIIGEIENILLYKSK